MKSPGDLAKLSRELLKITVEAPLSAEMDGRIGYAKHSLDSYNSGNSRNGYNRKTLKGGYGKIEIETPRDRNGTFESVFGADISPALVSQVTDAALDKVVEWQTRPLDSVCPILYLDCIVVKIRQDKRVINKAAYVALGVNIHGHKELLGLWMSENEGALSGYRC